MLHTTWSTTATAKEYDTYYSYSNKSIDYSTVFFAFYYTKNNYHVYPNY